MFLDYPEPINTEENVKKKISKKMEEYATSFTVHGLSKIFTGNTLEKLIWAICVLVALACSGLFTNIYVMKYRGHEIYQSVLERAETKAYFPQVTFCVLNLHPLFCEQFNACGRNIPENQPWSKSRSSFIWSNNVFIITSVYIKNIFQFDNLEIKPGDIISHEEVNDSCVTWHGQKRLYHHPFHMNVVALYLYVPQSIVRYVDPFLTVTIESQNISGLFQNPQVILKPGFSAAADLSKTFIIRKANPFPSNCIDKMKETNFPGLYSQKVCKYLTNTIQHCKKYNISLGFIERLMDKNLLNKSFAEQHCPSPCKETRYDISWILMGGDDKYCNIPNKRFDDNDRQVCDNEASDANTTKFAKFYLKLHFKHPDFFTITEEKELYTLQQMLGEIGGFFGLMIGASCMSLLELMIYLILVVIKKLQLVKGK